MLPDDLQFAVFRQRTTLDYMYPDNMQTAVVCCASKTVHTLKHAHALDARALLMSLSRLTGDVPLQTGSVPDLDGLVVAYADQSFAGWVKGECADELVVTSEGPEAFARGGTPDFDHAIVRTRDDQIVLFQQP